MLVFMVCKHGAMMSFSSNRRMFRVLLAPCASSCYPYFAAPCAALSRPPSFTGIAAAVRSRCCNQKMMSLFSGSVEKDMRHYKEHKSVKIGLKSLVVLLTQSYSHLSPNFFSTPIPASVQSDTAVLDALPLSSRSIAPMSL